MNRNMALLFGIPFAYGCSGDKPIESTKDPIETPVYNGYEGGDQGNNSSNNDDDDDDDRNYIQPVAVGFELVAGWDQNTGELLGWTLSDGSVQEPYVTITLASVDYFYGDDPVDSTCQFYAYFMVDELAPPISAELYNWPGGPGGTGEAVALWQNGSFEGYLEVFGENGETNCANVDPDMFPTGDYMETFNYMHFGIGFSELSAYTEEWIQRAWDSDGSGSLNDEELASWQQEKKSFMGHYIAVNHPNPDTEEGYDFVGYDWNYGRAFEFDSEKLEILTSECANDSSQQCMVPSDLQFNQGYNTVYVLSGARWYEDFPYLNLSMLQESNGLSVEEE